MDRCKSKILWQVGPFKICGDHFYLIEEVHKVVAASFNVSERFILVKKCQNCQDRKDITNLSLFDVANLMADYPMAFNANTLKELKYELSK